jgi:hypothetical protein
MEAAFDKLFRAFGEFTSVFCLFSFLLHHVFVEVNRFLARHKFSRLIFRELVVFIFGIDQFITHIVLISLALLNRLRVQAD